jgi:hypothetical protein
MCSGFTFTAESSSPFRCSCPVHGTRALRQSRWLISPYFTPMIFSNGTGVPRAVRQAELKPASMLVQPIITRRHRMELRSVGETVDPIQDHPNKKQSTNDCCLSHKSLGLSNQRLLTPNEPMMKNSRAEEVIHDTMSCP